MKGCDVAADIVLALVKADHTMSDLARIVYGDSGKSTLLPKYLQAFHAVGMVRVSGLFRGKYPTYRMQMTPFAEPDAFPPPWAGKDASR